ncbi:MAG: molybdopterin-binding protein, partial [Planctomycetota bacterium]|nr:molybdopterin-binding protein [Planctomycetota bacterium]
MSTQPRVDRAEIIAVGTELTDGSKLDTNSQWLSVELAGVGIPVLFHTAVADELEAMVKLFRAAAARSDLVIVSGGLGPTLDDLTRQALADAAGVPLVRHEPSLAGIRELFESR